MNITIQMVNRKQWFTTRDGNLAFIENKFLNIFAGYIRHSDGTKVKCTWNPDGSLIMYGDSNYTEHPYLHDIVAFGVKRMFDNKVRKDFLTELEALATRYGVKIQPKQYLNLRFLVPLPNKDVYVLRPEQRVYVSSPSE